MTAKRNQAKGLATENVLATYMQNMSCSEPKHCAHTHYKIHRRMLSSFNMAHISNWPFAKASKFGRKVLDCKIFW